MKLESENKVITDLSNNENQLVPEDMLNQVEKMVENFIYSTKQMKTHIKRRNVSR